MLGSRFLDNASTDSLRVYSFGYCDSRASFSLLQPVRHVCSLALKNGAQSDLTSSTRHVDGSLGFPCYTSMHYINDWPRIVVAVNSPCESMHGHVRTFSKQVIASITDDSHFGMSDVAFRTVPPIGGLSCLVSLKDCGERSEG